MHAVRWTGIGPSSIPLWEGAVPSPPKFLILKRHIFVDCLALKFIFITKRYPNDRTHGMQCMVVDGGRVIIRNKPFIDSE